LAYTCFSALNQAICS